MLVLHDDMHFTLWGLFPRRKLRAPHASRNNHADRRALSVPRAGRYCKAFSACVYMYVCKYVRMNVCMY